ncbi:MAG TPA: hypothetical protein P5026_02530 [Kiritimatiellia bacterium]|nr:hypothetical protein [Kiritimatiellia bacterium]HRU69665.1 hypothetical protein [Kiritimatiellia bacterium]
MSNYDPTTRKSQIERYHELVREILPKGVSFDALEQEQIDLALSHVNAFIRQSQSDRTPQNTNLRQSQCASTRGRAFTLPMVAFTLSGDHFFVGPSGLRKALTILNFTRVSVSPKC